MTNNFIYTGNEDGSQRYNQGPIYDPLRNKVVRKSIRLTQGLGKNLTQRLGKKRLIYDRFNLDSVSKESISFHQFKYPVELKRLDLLLHGNISEVCLRS